MTQQLAILLCYAHLWLCFLSKLYSTRLRGDRSRFLWLLVLFQK